MADNEPTTDRMDTEACRRFQSAWWHRQAQPLEAYLPAEDHPDYLGTLEQLVLLEMELAYQFRAVPSSPDTVPGDATLPRPCPDVAEYLARFPRLNQPAIVRRLAEQEFRLRRRHGKTPCLNEYRERFPTFVAPLETVPAAPPNLNVVDLPQVPGYEVQRLLARGGMGAVFLARQVSLNRLVALKMMGSRFADPEEVTRFRTEAEAMAHLTHPNIIQIHEIGECRGSPYVAMEYATGGTLAQALAGQPLPPPLAARLVETLARAMHCAHERGIIHRDLKPANILFAVSNQPSASSQTLQTSEKLKTESSLLTALPKITDFGLAKRLPLEEAVGPATRVTQSGTILGTPSYMAPEQAQGLAKHVGPAADVYALGAILYECLTGRPPFQAATAYETLQQVMEHEPVPVRLWQPQVPSDLQTICLKCLRKEPDQRYSSAAALANDLACFLADKPIHARPFSRAERLWRWCRRNRALASVTGVAVTALVLMGFQLLRGPGRAPEPTATGTTAPAADQESVPRQSGPVRVTNNTMVLVQYRYSLDNGATWTESFLEPGHFVDVTPTSYPLRVAYWAGPNWLDYQITGVPQGTAFYQFEPLPTGGVMLRGPK